MQATSTEPGGASKPVCRMPLLPERNRALDEIKGQVISDWKTAQKDKALYKLATDSSEALRSASVSSVAGNTGATVLKAQRLTRSSTQLGDSIALPSMMLSAIFSAQKDAATEAYALPDGKYVVAKVSDIRPADTKSAEGKAGIKKSQENLRAVYADDVFVQYMTYLQNKHGVSEPNQALIDSLLQ